MNYQDFVTSRVKWLETPLLDLVHAAMGLLGECVELAEARYNVINRCEEVGDLEFYAEHADQIVRKIGWGFFIQHEVSRDEARQMEADPQFWITHWCGEFHDRAKKAFIYNKELATLDFGNPLIRIRVCLFFLANQLGKTRADIQGENQAKLEKRYPVGYSDSAAQARADKSSE